VRHETHLRIAGILTNKFGVFRKNSNRDKISFLGLNCLFYLVIDPKIGRALYADNSFFEWLFNLFLEKSQHFDDRRFWIRSKLKATHSVDDDHDGNANGDSNEEKAERVPEYSTDEDCRLIQEVLRILFNFTLVETNVLRFKLDAFPAEFQRAVVGRAVHLLSIPCRYEPEFDLFCNAKCEHLLETPGLISIKIKICNVALYDGDILGMNLQPESAEPVCDLLSFYCFQTRHEYQTAQQVAAMMMFLKAVCKYNGRVRAGIKRYIFGDDAEPDAGDSDEESEEEEDPREAKEKMMRPQHLDEVADGEVTLKNYLIECCTSVNYNIKRTVAEFMFALCGDDQQEMIRLCGLGNAIGIFVDKGIPGFAGAADKGMNLEKLAKLKRKKEMEGKGKDGKDRQPPSAQ